MFHDRRMNGRALHDLAERARKEHWARKSAQAKRDHELELLLNANIPLAEAIRIVDGD